MKMQAVSNTTRTQQSAPKRGAARTQAQESFGDQVNLSPMKSTPVTAKWAPVQQVQVDTAGAVTRSLVPVLFLSDLDGTWLSPNAKNRETLDHGVLELKQEAREKGIGRLPTTVATSTICRARTRSGRSINLPPVSAPTGPLRSPRNYSSRPNLPGSTSPR